MAIKTKMNRLCCFLTGGHRYEDQNLICCSEPLSDDYIIRNSCVKCGKQYEVRIPEKCVMNIIYNDGRR